ncbi:MAG: hypothetical protein WA941_12225, partial [Nitrososphaeraceae archaeon]
RPIPIGLSLDQFGECGIGAWMVEGYGCCPIREECVPEPEPPEVNPNTVLGMTGNTSPSPIPIHLHVQVRNPQWMVIDPANLARP